MQKFIIALIFILGISIPLQAQIYLDSTQNYVLGGANVQVSPGDTIYLLAGHRPYLLFENIHGNADSVVVIINHSGKVIINTNHYFGISTKNCSYFKLSGYGDSSIVYGIDIQKVENGSGIGLSQLSNHFELEHIRIANTLLAGIYAKSDPDTTFKTVRDSFLMEDVYIHDNYLENIRDEGMYIGSTKWFGQHIAYQGGDTLLFPHYLEHVEIARNIIVRCGWDGIQLSSAHKNASIHDNQIYFDSYRNYPNQMSGIILGGGTKADCFNNYISHGNGTGILVGSLGGQKIYNNIIIKAGDDFYPNDITRMQHGIYIDDVSIMPDSAFELFNNLIYEPKSDGIRMRSTLSKNNLAFNNIIIRPGNYHYYDTLNTQFTADDAYIMLTDQTIDMQICHNKFSESCKNLGFTDTSRFDFTLTPNSILIDSGLDYYPFSMDFYHNPRIIGAHTDIGPFEFNSLTVHYQHIEKESTWKLAPNPIGDYFILRADIPLNLNKVKIVVYDSVGKIQKIPFNIEYENAISFDSSNLKCGVYFVKIQYGTSSNTLKMIKI